MFFEVLTSLLLVVDLSLLLVSQVILIDVLQFTNPSVGLLLGEGGVDVVLALALYKQAHVLLYVWHFENVYHRRALSLVFIQKHGAQFSQLGRVVLWNGVLLALDNLEHQT